MTIHELQAQGIDRVRLPVWNAAAYLKLDLDSTGLRGPWAKLYDPHSQAVIGEPTPQTILFIGDKNETWEAYTGE